MRMRTHITFILGAFGERDRGGTWFEDVVSSRFDGLMFGGYGAADRLDPGQLWLNFFMEEFVKCLLFK